MAYHTPAAVEETRFLSSVTCTVSHDRRWSWEQPTGISEIMLISRESTMASHFAWKQPWIISVSSDLFSHQTQCLLSPGCFIASICDGWGKHKQFIWSSLKSAPKLRRCSRTSVRPTVRRVLSSLYLNNSPKSLVNHCCFCFRKVMELPEGHPFHNGWRFPMPSLPPVQQNT